MLAKRIFYALIFAAIAVGFLMFKTPGFLALIFILGNICVYEINNALKQGGIKSSPVFGYVFMSLMIPAYLLFKDSGVLILLGICMCFNFCYFILQQKVDDEMLYSMLQLVYPCLMAAFVCPILYTDTNLTVGFAVLLSLILCCIATDVFAYFAGVYLGKHKLIPKISPKKTIEGSVGGFCGSVIMSAAIYVALPYTFGIKLPISFMVALGVECGIFAQFGDLTASMVKRICGIKDFGNLIPGHGGAMDRLDSILFCIPVTYMVIFIFKALGGM